MDLYILGHMGLGFLSAYALKRFYKLDFFVPLVWFCSVLPDFDVFIPFLCHRGPTHSVVVPLVLIPVFLVWFRKGLPYLVAFLSHSVVDVFTGYGGSARGMYLWPLSSRKFDLGFSLDMQSPVEFWLELGLFGLMVLVIFLERRRRT